MMPRAEIDRAGCSAAPQTRTTWKREIVGMVALTLLLLCHLPVVLAAADLTDVIVVFKTHFDIGYTDMASNVVQRYRTTMIDDALKVVDQNRDLPPDAQFVWTLPGWPLAKILEEWPGQTPDRQRRVRDAFRNGRFVTHALPFTTHTELLEPEDLVRGLGHASRLSREANLPLPRDAKMTDVPCHSWILPTLLRHAGVDFLHLGCNAASSSPKVPRLFWWEGPDGSRLLTMYTAESYGTGLVPPPDWPYRTWLALIHTGDNHGPPRPDEVKKLFENAKTNLPGVKVRIGRLSDFADALLAEKPDIPVVRGDMPDTWIHGPMSDPRGASIARTVRPQIAIAEFLSTLLPVWGVSVPGATEVVANAYENSLLYGEHTWGGAYWWIYGNYIAHYGDKWRDERRAGRFDRIESSWAEHTAYIENADRLVKPFLAGQMQALAEAVAEDGDRVVVFNPLPWPRTGSIAVAELDGTKFDRQAPGILRAPGGEARALYDLRGTQIRLWLSYVPPMGYCTLKHFPDLPDNVHLPRLDRDKGILHNNWLRAQLDTHRGTIESLKMQPSPTDAAGTDLAVEFVDKSSPFGLGQVLYERFDSNQVAGYVKSYVKIDAAWATNELGKPCLPPASIVPYSAASPTGFKVDYSVSSVAVEATLRAPPSENVPFGVTTRYLFYNTTEFFDIEVTIEKKPADPWPEAAWLCLPFGVDSPRFHLGRLGSIVDPATDIVSGANRHLFAVNTGLAVLDPSGRGIGICPIDSPLVSLETPGCWKYSTDFVPGKATVFINLFNNQWTTNFRLWNEGTWTSRVRIWPMQKYDAAESLILPSLEARFPLQAVCVTGKGGRLPAVAPGLSLGRGSFQKGKAAHANDPRLVHYLWHHNVLVTAFGPNPDGPGIVLRLWEMAGRSGDYPVFLPDGLRVSHAQPVDLRGRALGQAIPVEHGQFTAALKAFAPASFVLTP
jgi:alpha-mannosidase